MLQQSQPFARRFAFIVGAPRTGTTAIARMLARHPEVHFSALKEPHFFSQHDLSGADGPSLTKTVETEYLGRYFPGWRDRPGAMLAEGSVTYLYAPEQMGPILRLWPDARFVIGLRDPLELLPSLHQRLLFLGDETEQDFEQAWRLVDARAQGRNIPRSCIEPRWLRYDRSGLLGEQVDRFVQAVGPERCLFVLHDDLRADPAAAYSRVLKFLELPDIEYRDITPKRVSQGFRSASLQRLLMRPPFARKLLAGKHFRQRVEDARKLGRGRQGLAWVEKVRATLLRWNRAPAPRPLLSPAFRQELRDFYHADVRRMERLIGRDLSHWLTAAPCTMSRNRTGTTIEDS